MDGHSHAQHFLLKLEWFKSLDIEIKVNRNVIKMQREEATKRMSYKDQWKSTEIICISLAVKRMRKQKLNIIWLQETNACTVRFVTPFLGQSDSIDSSSNAITTMWFDKHAIQYIFDLFFNKTKQQQTRRCEQLILSFKFYWGQFSNSGEF